MPRDSLRHCPSAHVVVDWGCSNKSPAIIRSSDGTARVEHLATRVNCNANGTVPFNYDRILSMMSSGAPSQRSAKPVVDIVMSNVVSVLYPCLAYGS